MTVGKTREQGITWVISRQLNRRNLTPNEVSYLRGKRYNAEKQPHGGQLPGSLQNANTTRSAERLSGKLGVHPTTIIHDGAYATAIDIIAKNVGDDAAREIRRVR